MKEYLSEQAKVLKLRSAVEILKEKKTCKVPHRYSYNRQGLGKKVTQG